VRAELYIRLFGVFAMIRKKTKLLELNNITKDFSGTRALDDVSIDLFEGEVHCLIGENGAGKSTLIKILSGAEKPDRGIIKIFGKSYLKLEPRESINLSISTIYQDVDLVDTLTVADNIFLGNEIAYSYGAINAKEQVRRAREIMERLNIKIDVKKLVEELSPAHQQTLQIVKALYRDARIIIMDEPTSSLGQEETKALMELIRTITSKGVGVLYISHYLEEVFEIGDRITVLKDGKKINTYNTENIRVDAIIKDMVGREASLFYKRERVPIGKTMAKIMAYSRGEVVKNVTFDVREGEIFGIGGLVGSGRTELVNLLFGIDKRESGSFTLDGREITPRTPKDAIEKGLCMIVENRKDDGLFLIRSVKENIGIVHTDKSNFMIQLKNEIGLVRQMIQRLRIDVSGLDQEVGNLSGGNQQKSIMARWLLTKARLFIFDEPTKGVDIGSKEEIYKFMTELAREGKAIIMVSSDMPELLSMSDRIGIMRSGELVKIIDSHNATEEKILTEFFGLGATN
jgi:ribose transport system ATP-binding protein